MPSSVSWDLSALMAWHHSVPSKQLRAREQATVLPHQQMCCSTICQIEQCGGTIIQQPWLIQEERSSSSEGNLYIRKQVAE
mmetsp:Transcript_71113/g.156943  ORF Transcript_71113/g.156943 Transcript_71113/m.156943 type:complete len:81 (-) Transcript_71113:65-307(-)